MMQLEDLPQDVQDYISELVPTDTAFEKVGEFWVGCFGYPQEDWSEVDKLQVPFEKLERDLLNEFMQKDKMPNQSELVTFGWDRNPMESEENIFWAVYKRP